MTKLRIFIDMDGVLADFYKAKENHPDFGKKGFKPDLELDFSTFEPILGAIEAVQKLIDMGHDLFIATTPPWNHPDAWGQKRNWVEEHLPALKRKMFLTHRKDLLIGDILIDDTTYRGQKDFTGQFIHFGIGNNKMNWPQITDVIQQMTHLSKIIN
jgi:5'(3')-deoxyribonucleotidase